MVPSSHFKLLRWTFILILAPSSMFENSERRRWNKKDLTLLFVFMFFAKLFTVQHEIALIC